MSLERDAIDGRLDERRSLPVFMARGRWSKRCTRASGMESPSALAFGLALLLAAGCSAPSVDPFEGKGNPLPEKKKSTSRSTSSHTTDQDASSSRSRGARDAGADAAMDGSAGPSSSSSSGAPPTDPEACFRSCVAKNPAAAAYIDCTEANRCSIPSACDDACFFDTCAGQEEACDLHVQRCDQQCPVP